MLGGHGRGNIAELAATALVARLKPIEDEREIRDDLYLIVFSVHIEAVRRQHR